MNRLSEISRERVFREFHQRSPICGSSPIPLYWDHAQRVVKNPVRILIHLATAS